MTWKAIGMQDYESILDEDLIGLRMTTDLPTKRARKIAERSEPDVHWLRNNYDQTLKPVMM
jgi:hypothetical protein